MQGRECDARPGNECDDVRETVPVRRVDRSARVHAFPTAFLTAFSATSGSRKITCKPLVYVVRDDVVTDACSVARIEIVTQEYHARLPRASKP
eukprot:9497022-Pyramimonas_sp.AAC.4